MRSNVGTIIKFKKDDLTVIEGIEQETAQLLIDQDIVSWQALAKTSVDRILEILNDRGANYLLLDPGTWPQQAKMAAREEWDKFQAYHDFLIEGKA